MVADQVEELLVFGEDLAGQLTCLVGACARQIGADHGFYGHGVRLVDRGIELL